jgi:H+-transporting ATPase
MVLMMVTGEFLAMSSSTDNVRPSRRPNILRIHNLTIAGVIMGMIDLIFCGACLAIGKYVLGLDTVSLRTLTVVTLVLSGQAVFYVARERQRLWNSCPERWLLLSSAVDLAIFGVLASHGILMSPLPVAILAVTPAASLLFALILESIKVLLFEHLAIA